MKITEILRDFKLLLKKPTWLLFCFLFSFTICLMRLSFLEHNTLLKLIELLGVILLCIKQCALVYAMVLGNDELMEVGND